MLAVSPLTNTKDERQNEMAESFSVGGDTFADLCSGNLLGSIDFDELFSGINDGDVLPDLEMDSGILADFGEETETNASASAEGERLLEDIPRKEDDDKVSGLSNVSGSNSNQGEEILSKGDESSAVSTCPKEADKGRKPCARSKNPQGKRKVKVDWTPELHRKFVQAVEQLGVDKAVPSRILELMGTDFLTRHNVASHLQKYRSHRKHLLAREAEAASWNQRRQIYGSPAGGGSKTTDTSPWLGPTMGFPPMAPLHHFRPLHVWGHPHPPLHHLPPTPPPPHPPPPADPSFWLSQHQRFPNSLLLGPPCYQPPLASTRFPIAPVPGIPPHAMYKVELGMDAQTVPTGQTYPNPPFDLHPSKESIDAAIGDVLTKPLSPLPLGLKAPSVDGVLGELQRQGISTIPPPSCTTYAR